MKYREAMNCLSECQLGAIVIDKDEIIVECNQAAVGLLRNNESLINNSMNSVVEFFLMEDSDIAYAEVGFGQYIKQCKAPEVEDLPPDSKMIVFQQATKDILCEMLIKVFNRLDESVIVCDAQSRIVLLNEAAVKMDSLPIETVIGKSIGDVYHMQDDSFLAIPKVIEDKQPRIDLRQNYATLYGKNVDIVASNYPIIEEGYTLGGFAVMKDWSHVDELNKQIIDLQSKLVKNSVPGAKRKAGGQALSSKYSFRDIIYISPAMHKVVNKCRQVAKSDSSVMIYGETGSGKEMISQSIHGASARANYPFLAINCAAIPINLLESMLFGTEKGAYTGAESREGLFEQANGGTLFLDEINSMDLSLQSKLLRVLQDGIVRRVGGTTEIRVDVRVISNINIPPYQAIEENKLRQDLFYRLGVVIINVPALRERKEDISLLTKHFIQILNKKLLKNISDIDAATLDLFYAYDWPGNVRELQHAIEHAMNLVPRDISVITPAYIPEHIVFKVTGYTNQNGDIDDIPKSLPEILDDVESRILRKALKENGGNISKTAQTLGVSRQNLQYRLKKNLLKNDLADLE